MPRMTIVALASACVLAATPVLAQSSAPPGPATPAPSAQTTVTPAPMPQPAAVTPGTDDPATIRKPAGKGGCDWKARQVMS